MLSFLSKSRAILGSCRLTPLTTLPSPLFAALFQRRWNWQIHLRQLRDPTGKLKYEDWSKAMRNMKQPRLANGLSLLRRSLRRTRHIKPTMWNKFINQRKVYRRQIKRIDDLTNYIQFMNEVKKK